MGLEKIGLLFLLNYMNQLGTVKNHLLLSAKELLLAVNASFDIVSQSTHPKIKGTGVDVVSPLVKQAQSLLSFTIDKIAPDEESLKDGGVSKDNVQLKEHIVGSIISAIDDEIGNTRHTTSEKSKLKIEALQTVKEVLTKQIEKSLSTCPKSEAKPSRKARVA